MSDPIVGKVAAVVDDTTLVLNVGSVHGVREGMLFAIVSEHQEIEDPDTGESLGNWEAVKARVIVSHVQEKMCTVRSLLAEETDTSGTLSAMMVRHSFGLYGQRSDERHTLSVRSGSVAGKSPVKPIDVGDGARSITLDEMASAVESSDQEDDPAQTPDLPSSTYATTPHSSQAESPSPGDAADADSDESQGKDE